MNEQAQEETMFQMRNGHVNRGYSSLAVRPVKIRGVKDAKRLLSRLIYELQQGIVSGRDAKDLCYLLNSYVQITKETEFEERLKALEEKMS